MSAVEITGLKKSFHKHRVLDGVDLRLDPGQLVCLIGRSGCGKSTLLRCLNGLEVLDAGAIRIGSHELRAIPLGEFQRKAQNLRQEVGFVFQQFQLFPHLTLLENVMLGPLVVKGFKRDQARDLAERLLARVDLKAHQEKFPSQLSGGQQQRGAIARALALQPKVMLYDEPTSALDPELVDEVLQVMKDLDTQENLTQVVVTHEMRFAREAADLVVFLHDGKICEQGPPEQIFAQPQQELTRQFLRKFL